MSVSVYVYVCVCVWGGWVGGKGGLHMTAVFGKALFRSISATTLSNGYTAAKGSVWILVL